MRILYIAYPLLTVSEESAGGAEQVLWTLEQEIAHRGSETAVAASRGSKVAGRLFATGDPCREMDDFERRNREHQERILELVHEGEREGRSFDLVHDMSGSFWARASEIGATVLATLHLPRTFYPAHFFDDVAGNVVFNFVSRTQADTFSDLNLGATVIANGIALDRFDPNPNSRERSGLLWLGRICEEKAPHLALEIARRASLPITLAGQVYPFSYHQRYFHAVVAPLLSAVPGARFMENPSHEEKSHLLHHAKALLITSQAEETSSLVAMEAAASGTPVIAFRRGALAEVVCDGVTGLLVDGVEAAVEALGRITEIDPVACIGGARKNFSSRTMTDAYIHLYQALGDDPKKAVAVPAPGYSALG